MATAAQQQAFINANQAYATAAAQATGNSPAEILGQWALETGWGTNYAGKNNPGNIMQNGVAVNYPTMNQGVGAYVTTLQSDQVTGQALNPAGFAQDLQQANYAGNQANYGQSVLNTIESIPASVNNQQYGSGALNQLQSSNPQIAQAGLQGLKQNAIPSTTASCPTFDFWNPWPWAKCQSGNMIFIFLGLVIVVGAIWFLIQRQK